MANKQMLLVGGVLALLATIFGAYSVLAGVYDWAYVSDMALWGSYLMVGAVVVLLYALFIAKGGSGRGIGGVMVVSAWMYIIGAIIPAIEVLGISIGLDSGIMYVLSLLAWFGIGGFAVSLYIEYVMKR